MSLLSSFLRRVLPGGGGSGGTVLDRIRGAIAPPNPLRTRIFNAMQGRNTNPLTQGGIGGLMGTLRQRILDNAQMLRSADAGGAAAPQVAPTTQIPAGFASRLDALRGAFTPLQAPALKKGEGPIVDPARPTYQEPRPQPAPRPQPQANYQPPRPRGGSVRTVVSGTKMRKNNESAY